MTAIDASVQRRQRRRNQLQMVLLLGGMVAVLALCAWLIVGPRGFVMVALIGAVTLAIQPRVPPDWVLRIYGARPLPYTAAPRLHHVVAVLSQRAGLPRAPVLHYVPSRTLNAFAVGRPGAAALGVTDGLLRNLSPRELVGVLAHEVSHIRADDLHVMTLADTIGRLTHGLAYLGMFALLLVGFPVAMVGTLWPLLLTVVLTSVPTVVTLLQLALSRSREYDADLAAVDLTGDPEGLASALLRLEQHEGRIWERIMVPHRRGPDPLLLRTHPPTAERVRRLRELIPQQPKHLHLEGQDTILRDPPVPVQPLRLRAPGIRW